VEPAVGQETPSRVLPQRVGEEQPHGRRRFLPQWVWALGVEPAVGHEKPQIPQ
jgi:hypothetical protein